MKKEENYQKKNSELFNLLTPDIVNNTKLITPMPFGNYDNEALIDFLERFYDSDQTKLQITASLINAIFTTGSPVFVLSQRLFADLIKEDVNTSLNSLNTESYKNILTNLFERDIIDRIRQPYKRAAGLYKLTNPHLLDIFKKMNPEIDIKQTEKDAIKRWDKITNKKYPDMAKARGK